MTGEVKRTKRDIYVGVQKGRQKSFDDTYHCGSIKMKSVGSIGLTISKGLGWIFQLTNCTVQLQRYLLHGKCTKKIEVSYCLFQCCIE